MAFILNKFTIAKRLLGFGNQKIKIAASLSLPLLIVLLLSACSRSVFSKASSKEATPTTIGKRYGKLINQATPPRGGTTVGPKLSLAQGIDSAWQKVVSAETKKEKDQAAIKAMAGEYRTSFEFVETVSFLKDRALVSPYQSWATEKIYIIADDENFISLQHILVMTFIVEGVQHGPFVMKHWRQDWKYQPNDTHQYLSLIHI